MGSVSPLNEEKNRDAREIRGVAAKGRETEAMKQIVVKARKGSQHRQGRENRKKHTAVKEGGGWGRNGK